MFFWPLKFSISTFFLVNDVFLVYFIYWYMAAQVVFFFLLHYILYQVKLPILDNIHSSLVWLVAWQDSLNLSFHVQLSSDFLFTKNTSSNRKHILECLNTSSGNSQQPGHLTESSSTFKFKVFIFVSTEMLAMILV